MNGFLIREKYVTDKIDEKIGDLNKLCKTLC